ncbi:MAG: hypothetical protein Q9163_000374 [Psora crenata]
MEAVKQTIAQNTGLPGAHTLVPESQQFSLEETPDLSGKVAVVTGGSQGIGYGCTHTLLSHNIAKIFILSISKDVIHDSLDAIKQEMGEETAKRVVWIQCDLANWSQVVETANIIQKQTDRLDILINNAARGIMTFKLTDYGVDLHMALNHIGHAVLTSHLLPLLKSTVANHDTTVRIVNLASNAHQNAPSDCKFESLEELNQDLGPNPQYGRTKLAAILYSRYLARHLTKEYPKILVNATHPGVVETKQSTKDIHEPYPLGGYAMSVGLAPLKKDIMQGCVSTVFAATVTEGSGQYICPPAVPESGNGLAQNEQLGENLMKLTREIVKEKTFKDSAEQGCPFKDY